MILSNKSWLILTNEAESEFWCNDYAVANLTLDKYVQTRLASARV